MVTAVKLYLRSTPDKKSLDRFLQYMKTFGHGETRIARQGRFTVVLVANRRDGDIVRHQFEHLVEAWVDYRQ